MTTHKLLEDDLWYIQQAFAVVRSQTETHPAILRHLLHHAKRTLVDARGWGISPQKINELGETIEILQLLLTKKESQQPKTYLNQLSVRSPEPLNTELHSFWKLIRAGESDLDADDWKDIAEMRAAYLESQRAAERRLKNRQPMAFHRTNLD